MSSCTSIFWPSGHRPLCTRCSSLISVYRADLGGETLCIGTWCPSCDSAHGSNVGHFMRRVAADMDPSVVKRVRIMVPKDQDAFDQCKSIMDGDGERRTWHSPA